MSREPPGPADVVVSALSPALVMGLVGSLAFFLIELVYRGDYPERLRWTMFFFVFASVLVARIAITLDAAMASGYGLALGFVTLLALNTFVKYPNDRGISTAGWLINLTAMGVVWWSANRLTWDCTFLSDDAEDTGRGLLEDAGLDETADRDAPKPPGRTPGVWVVYFVIATLPLYGLGQALIPPDDVAARRYAFWLMAIYAGCGLGLLMTTSFLSLRRYLRQRKLRMPLAMTGLWLALGGGIIVAFLVIGALLPRPRPEYAWLKVTPAESPEAKASERAMASEKGAKGDGQPGGQGKAKDAPAGKDGRGEKGGKDGKTSGKSQSPGKANDKGDAKSADKTPGKTPSDAPAEPPPSADSSWLDGLRWLVFALLIAATIAAVIWMIARYWQRSTPRERTDDDEDEMVAAPALELPPFHAFADPFADGTAQRRSPEWLARYSFAALESWAAEHDLARPAEETPIEFARRVVAAEAALDPGARHVAALYARLAYADGPLPATAKSQLELFWRAAR